MANATLAQTTPALLIAAGTLVKLAHPGDASLARALDKAQDRLLTHPWRVVFDHLEIVSASHPNEVHISDGAYCSCKTVKGVCWHRASWMLIATVRATGVQLQPALPLPDMDALEDAADYDDGDFLDYYPTTVDRRAA